MDSIWDILKKAIGIPTEAEKQKQEQQDKMTQNVILGFTIFFGLLFLGLLILTMVRKK